MQQMSGGTEKVPVRMNIIYNVFEVHYFTLKFSATLKLLPNYIFTYFLIKVVLELLTISIVIPIYPSPLCSISHISIYLEEFVNLDTKNTNWTKYILL